MPVAAPTPVLDPALDAVATLYTYPRGEDAGAARGALATIQAASPAAAADLLPLVDFLATSELAAREELYVRTFELNPMCALEVGWQLYGEQYARGTFLVRTRQLTRDAGLDPGTELPDHLPNILRIVARLDGPSARKLATRFATPAVVAMAEKLGSASKDNPYCGLLTATATLLGRHADEQPPHTPAPGPEVQSE